MATPRYVIEVSKRPRTPCIECRRLTGAITGTRNGRPICDVCLVNEEPRLGAFFALHATLTALARGFPPRRPQASRVFAFVCDHGRDLAGWFRRGWRSAIEPEMRLSSAFDLTLVKDRALTIGGPAAARQFEDTKWVAASIRKAKRKGVNVRGYLLIAAIERAGIKIDEDKRERLATGTTLTHWAAYS